MRACFFFREVSFAQPIWFFVGLGFFVLVLCCCFCNSQFPTQCRPESSVWISPKYDERGNGAKKIVEN